MSSQPLSTLHDLHCHSYLSACSPDETNLAPAIFRQARDWGYDTLCLADHLWDSAVPGASDWYRPQDIPHVLSAKPEAHAEGMRCLVGCETEYIGAGRLGLAREHFDLFDFVVIPPNHFHMEGFTRPAHIQTPAQVAALFLTRLEEIGQLDIPHEKVGIAHLTCSLLYRAGSVAQIMELLDEKRLGKIFDVFAKKGAGIELNAHSFKGWTENPDAFLQIYRIAKKAGCKFYCASDAHTLAKYADMAKNLPPVIEALGLTEEDRYIVPN